MKTVFKLFLIFLTSLFFCSAVHAEKMPLYPYPKDFNVKDNPIAYPYFESYAKKLYEAFDAKRLWMLPMGYGVSVTWILHKYGSVSDITPEWNDNKIPLSYKYGMSIIENNPPPPFPKDLDEESIRIRVFFCKYNYDEINMDYYPETKKYPTPSSLSISITKNYKIKKHITPDITPMFKSFK